MAVFHKVAVKTYLTPSELNRIYDDAARLETPVSKYMRFMVKRHIQPEPTSTMCDVLKLHSDLVWHAMIFRHAMDRGKDLQEVAAQIEETQTLLRFKIKEL